MLMNKIIMMSKRFSVPVDPVSPTIVDMSPETHTLDAQLLSCIYGVDPVTGIPNGDIAVYLSENTSPEIKEYISNKLMKENMTDESVLSLPQDVINKFRGVITDDDIAIYSRNHDETDAEYASRIKYLLAKQKEDVQRKKKDAELRKLLEGDK